MAQRAKADRDRRDDGRQREAGFVDPRIGQQAATDTQRLNQHQRGETMHEAQRRQRDADIVDPAANRREEGVRHNVRAIYVTLYRNASAAL